MEVPSKDLLFANMMPNLLHYQQIKEKQTPKSRITLMTWVYSKAIFDLTSSLVVIPIGIYYTIRLLQLYEIPICVMNLLCGFCNWVMTATLALDTRYTLLMALHIAKKEPNNLQIRMIYNRFMLCRKILIAITGSSLCLTLVAPVSFLFGETDMLHALIDSIVYLLMFITGMFWLGLDYIVMQKAKEEYSFSYKKIFLYLDNSRNNTEKMNKHILYNMGEIEAEIETKVGINEENMKEDDDTPGIDYIRQFPLRCSILHV